MKSLIKLLSCCGSTRTPTALDDSTDASRPAVGPKSVTGPLPDDLSTDSDDVPARVFAAKEPDDTRATAIPQASGQDGTSFLLRLPLEIRRKVYVEILAEAGPMQHIYRSRDHSNLRPRYGTTHHRKGDPYRRFMDGKDTKSRFRHEPCCIRSPLLPQMDQALYYRDGVHFDKDPSCMFLPLLLICRQV